MHPRTIRRYRGYGRARRERNPFLCIQYITSCAFLCNSANKTGDWGKWNEIKKVQKFVPKKREGCGKMVRNKEKCCH